MANPFQIIEDKTSMAANGWNGALGYALPPIIPFKDIVLVKGGRSGNIESVNGLANLGDNFFQCPVSFNTDGGQYTLPIDPLISVSNKNVIKRRYVSKSRMRGSVKECWSQDDCEVTIAGVIIAEDASELSDKVARLRGICERAEAVEIVCEYLNSTFGIDRIAIESCDFPFTKGMENQSFIIKAFSDDGYELLEEA